jgi:Cu/Ag efflux protein CusF
VVTSGQFLLDSEASLKGIVASSEEESPPTATSSFHEADGQIVEINDKEVTLAHGPFKTLGMPGMTMTFPLATPALMQGLKTGDKVRIAVSQTDDGLRVERLEIGEPAMIAALIRWSVANRFWCYWRRCLSRHGASGRFRARPLMRCRISPMFR